MILEIAAGVALAPVLVWLTSMTVLGCLLLLAVLVEIVRTIISGTVEVAAELLAKSRRCWCGARP